MYGIVVIAASFALPVQPTELPKDAWELEAREFLLPLRVKQDAEGQIERIRLYMSQNGGKTWTHVKDAKATDDNIRYKAPKDGLFYFALQIVYRNGKCEPAELNQLTAQQKVYVNTEHKTLKPQKSYEDLQSEVEELHKTVERLKKRVAELEEKR